MYKKRIYNLSMVFIESVTEKTTARGSRYWLKWDSDAC